MEIYEHITHLGIWVVEYTDLDTGFIEIVMIDPRAQAL
jgi:hypothetical protein